MVALPNTTAVSGIVTGLSEDGVDQPFGFTEAAVACETPRRRPVGSVSLLLVDVPWSGLDLFRRGSSLRSSSLQLVSIISDAWINQAMAEPELQESMGEYATAAEEVAEDEVDGEAENDAEEPEPNEELARLRAQVAALERAAQSHPPPTGLGRASGTHGRRGARDLFPAGAGTELSGGDLERLRAAAGAPPPRIAQHERAPRETAVQQADDLLAELDLEAAQDETRRWLNRPSASQVAAHSDPHAESAHCEPPPGAVGICTGFRRSQRRRQLERSRQCGWGCLRPPAQRQCAGVVADSAVGGRGPRRVRGGPACESYATVHRAPLPDRRAQDLSLGGFRSQPMPGSGPGRPTTARWRPGFARLILFVDQAGTENGRTQLAWLLSGLPEPSWSTMMRRKSGIKPFAKSCPSLWASANLAYLREMDWLSSKISSSGGGDPPKDGGKDAAATEENDPPQRPPRRPRRPKGAQES